MVGPNAVSVNLCHGRDALAAHLRATYGDVVHQSVEAPVALGTAGAVAQLRPWLNGRGALVVNGDTWCPAPLADLVEGWDGTTVRVLVSPEAPLHARSGIVASLLPWSEIVALPLRPSGLWEVLWRDRLAEGRLESVGWPGSFVDCATAADYLRANLAALDAAGVDRLVDPTATVTPQGRVGPGSVVGAGAVVAGSIESTVLWPGAVVDPGERLVDAVRTARRTTVLVR